MYCNTWIHFGAAEIYDCSMMAFFIGSTASECISMSAEAPHNNPKNNVGKHHHNDIALTVFLGHFARASALNTVETGFNRIVEQVPFKSFSELYSFET